MRFCEAQSFAFLPGARQSPLFCGEKADWPRISKAQGFLARNEQKSQEAEERARERAGESAVPAETQPLAEKGIWPRGLPCLCPVGLSDQQHKAPWRETSDGALRSYRGCRGGAGPKVLGAPGELPDAPGARPGPGNESRSCRSMSVARGRSLSQRPGSEPIRCICATKK